MFITNHVLSGAVIGRKLERHPVYAFVAGVGSHLVIDAIPHWGGCDWYNSPTERRRFMTVAKRDGVLGLGVMTVAALGSQKSARRSTVAAMVGASMLDLDKPFYIYLGWNPFPKWVRRLHKAVQSESPGGLPNEFAFGLAFAAINITQTVRARRQL
jgi:hypothetical protein